LDISKCLTNSFNNDSETLIKQNSYNRIFSQLDSIKKKGPTIKYCQLVLIINKFELINNIESDIVDKLYGYVINIQDKSISLACLSIITKYIQDESITSFSIDIENEKNKLVDHLLISDAYHIEVFKDAIKFEAKNNLLTAISWSQKLNTEPRRDKAKATAIESYCLYMNQQNMTVPLDKLIENIRYIKDESVKVSVYKALVKNVHKLELSKKDFKSIFKIINRIENRRLRVKYITDLSTLSIKKGIYVELSTDIIAKIEESIYLIDGISNQIDTSFYIYGKFLKFDKNTASKFKDIAIKLRNENTINNQYVVDYLVHSISLSIRSLYILAEFKLDDQDCFDHVVNNIQKIPSIIMQAKLFARLASAYQKALNIEKAKLIIESHLMPLLIPPLGQISTEYNLCLSAALPILALYKTSLFTEYLDKLSKKNKILKDRTIIHTINYYYRNCLIDDTYESIKNQKYSMDFSDLKDIIYIISLLSDDAATLYQIKELLEAITSSKKNKKISNTQQNDLISAVNSTFKDCFPKDNYIAHEGYKILFLTFTEKFAVNTRASWLKIIDSARKIPNVSDRAFTLLEISNNIGAISTELQKELIREADGLIDSLTSNLEKVNRYSQLCEYAKGTDRKTASLAIKKALKITNTNDIDENSNARLNAIDMAYKLGDSFAGSLANTFDDDPARKELIQKEIAERKAKDENKKKFEKNLEIDSNQPDDSIYRLAWKQLGALNANSCHISKGFDISKYIKNDIPITLEQLYMLLSFYTHYLSKAMPSKEKVRENIRPIFDEVIKNISTVLEIYSNNSDVTKTIKTQNKQSTKHIIVNEGEIDVAVEFIKQWYIDKKGGELVIIDPYFTLEDLSIIGDVIERDPEVSIKILSSKESMKKILKITDNDFEDIVAEYWNDSVSTSSLPSIEFIFANYGNKDQIPIHDRWWLTTNGAIHTGTSANGFAQRISQISILDLDDKISVLEAVEPFLEMKQKYYQEERVRYRSFRL
jgi:hypothetical protein